MAGARRRDQPQRRQPATEGARRRARQGRLHHRRQMPRRRPRRASRAPALPAAASPPLAVNESARALPPRGQTANQGDRPLPRRAELSHARLGRARPPDHPPDQCWPLEPTATPRTNATVTRPRRRLSLAPAARPQRACVQRPLRRLPARSKQAWLTATRQARPMPTQRPCVRTVRLDVLISGASARQKVAVTTAQAEEESTTDRMNAPAACRRASHPPGSAAGDEIAGGSAAAGD